MGGGDWRVDEDVPSGVQRERGRELPESRHPRPGDRIDYSDIASRPAIVRCGNGDVGAAHSAEEGREGSGIYIGRGRAGGRREDAGGGGESAGDEPFVRISRERDRYIGRVEQPRAGLAIRCTGVDPDAFHVQPVGGGFDQAAVAALRTAARGDAAIGARRVVGPQHDCTAAAIGGGVSADR